MTLLLTGFAPFGGEDLNPSWEAVRRLDGERLGDLPVVAAQLPTEFGTALRVLDDLLERHRPTLVVAVGQAGGRAELSLERIAINVDDARIPDNAGRQPIDEPVVAGGPAAYFSTLPIKAMVHALRAAGIPAAVYGGHLRLQPCLLRPAASVAGHRGTQRFHPYSLSANPGRRPARGAVHGPGDPGRRAAPGADLRGDHW